MNKNSDLTLDIEKPNIEESSASSTGQIVPNDEHVSNHLAEQQSSSVGGQEDFKVAGSKGTDLTSVPTGHARNFGRATNIALKSKMVKKKPSFVELLHKYQRIAEQNQSNRLGDQNWNSSSPKVKKHRRSSHWSSSFILSMHVPWNAYSGISCYNPWFWYNP